jgi:5-hydroxyisourate hydrolase
MGQITTHVLDTANGLPAAGIAVRLLDAQGQILAETITNQNGRCDQPLLEGDLLKIGAYTVVFATAAYFRSRGATLAEPPFLDEIPIRFAVADPGAHYHIPLLVSPWSFATYRGS